MNRHETWAPFLARIIQGFSAVRRDIAGQRLTDVAVVQVHPGGGGVAHERNGDRPGPICAQAVMLDVHLLICDALQYKRHGDDAQLRACVLVRFPACNNGNRQDDKLRLSHAARCFLVFEPLPRLVHVIPTIRIILWIWVPKVFFTIFCHLVFRKHETRLQQVHLRALD